MAGTTSVGAIPSCVAVDQLAQNLTTKAEAGDELSVLDMVQLNIKAQQCARDTEASLRELSSAHAIDIRLLYLLAAN